MPPATPAASSDCVESANGGAPAGQRHLRHVNGVRIVFDLNAVVTCAAIELLLHKEALVVMPNCKDMSCLQCAMRF